MDKATITIPCKPYVKKHLVNSYGDPADLTGDRQIYRMFIWLINRKVFRNSKRIKDPEYGKKLFYEEIKVEIKKQDLPGEEINKAAFIEFNGFIEGFIKKIARTFIIALEYAGWKRSEAVKEFQSTFGYREEEYSRAAIKVDLKRNPEFIEKILDCSKKRSQ